MGNNLSAAGAGASNSGGAIGAGVVVAGTVLPFGSMVAYFTCKNLGMWGWDGPIGLVAVAGAGAGAIVAAKIARNRSERRAIERAYAAWYQEIAKYPERLHYALTLLADPWDSVLMWTHPRIGIGRAPDQRIAGDIGDGPRLLPGQDPGYEPDYGWRPSPSGVVLRIALPQGVSPEMVQRVLPNLASSLHVPRAQIVSSDGHVIRLELKVRNPLEATRTFQAPDPSPVPLKSLRVGVREDGEPYRIQIWNTHLFLAGLTGSGKSGVLWSIIGAMAPDIQSGRVQLHMIDLKKGTEMAAGYRLYASWAWRVSEAIALLEKMIRILDERATPRREHAMRTGEPLRNHEPRPGDPHHVVMIDEVIALVKLVGDRKGTFNVPQLDGSWKEETMRVDKYVVILLLELLSQARSFGITIIVSTQNAAKDIFDLLRDMFPIMVGLRQASEQQVQMVYGSGAKERGIEASAITVDQAGTAFIDSPEAGGAAMRVRFYRVSDEDIIQLVRIFGRSADAPALPTLTSAPIVVDSAPVDADVQESDAGNVVAFTPLAEQINTAAPRCLYCGAEIELLPGGGRPPKFCRKNNHRQLYHRDKKRMESQKKTS